MPSLRLQAYFDDYASYHRTRGNQVSHYFGISFIVIGLFGLLSSLLVSSEAYIRLDGATLLILITLPYYFYLDWKISIPYAFFLGGLYFFSRTLPPSALWTLFIAGWILQGIGHAIYEKKSPAFSKNVVHLLIGPFWIFSKLLRYSK